MMTIQNKIAASGSIIVLLIGLAEVAVARSQFPLSISVLKQHVINRHKRLKADNIVFSLSRFTENTELDVRHGLLHVVRET